jgi:UDP-N-acetylmuramyl pentapeptide phosphotransferase/UDP-N-acetylglucosamine-1-phosphate transferase
MSKLQITDKIRKEEKKKIKPIIIGIIIIIACWLAINFILEIPRFAKQVAGLLLFIAIIYLLIRLYRAYYG